MLIFCLSQSVIHVDIWSAGILSKLQGYLKTPRLPQNVTFNKRKGIVKVRAKKLNGFSLMEMMVVLLIVAIIAAASAPMVTKKLSRSAGTGDSPWVFTGLNNSIAYNMSGNDNSTVIIGSTTTPANMQGATRLYIDSGNNASHIAFGNGDTVPLLLTADPTRGRIGFSNREIPNSSVAFGINQTLSGDHIVAIGAGAIANNSGAIGIGRAANARSLQSIAIGGSETDRTIAAGDNAIAIGSEAETNNMDSVAIGTKSLATYERAIAIGRDAQALGEKTIAIGYGSNVHIGSDFQEGGIAIGNNAIARGVGSIAIGDQPRVETAQQGEVINGIAIGSVRNGSERWTRCQHNNSVAIGIGAQTTAEHQIVLGSDRDTVFIPGHLVVDGDVLLGGKHGSKVYMRECAGGGGHQWLHLYTEMRALLGHNCFIGEAQSDGVRVTVGSETRNSDRRLKNVGEKYTAGLAELKKLDFFHFTFKEDKEKTPHVGVMAQDLQKVFPDAVTKGEDGYLRIRWDDMFYAVINAVKELDNKITEIVQNITDINSTIEKQNKTIEEQQKTIDELVKRIEKLEKQK